MTSFNMSGTLLQLAGERIMFLYRALAGAHSLPARRELFCLEPYLMCSAILTFKLGF